MRLARACICKYLEKKLVAGLCLNLAATLANRFFLIKHVNTLSDTIRRITGADQVGLGEEIQSLWSGYGVIQRATLHGGRFQNSDGPVHIVVKHIDITRARSNPRGWGNDIAHQRKVRSYQVEKTFYEIFSGHCGADCRVPRFVSAHEKEGEGGWIIVLEDLDSVGFGIRKSGVEREDIEGCLRWLATFHATFLGSEAGGLWPVGTYWHLETRPDEYAAMVSGPLKESAKLIDQRLNQASYQTLVHGDAKVANFCFPGDASGSVAAVDFQYVGRGCGMKDVAYFISSVLDDKEAAKQQEGLLAFYFQQLRDSVSARGIAVDFTALEREWRILYPFAWADFCRFLSGWAPGHWKLNSYNDQITKSVLEQLHD